MATLLTLPLFPLVFFSVVLFPGLPATFPLLEEEVGFKESDLLEGAGWTFEGDVS